jgi:hypothetical protein
MFSIRKAVQSLDAREGLHFIWLVTAFGAACLLVILRSPAMFSHARFYAEDGAVWYAQAYNGGWLHSLTLAAGGYLNTLQRLIGGAALLVPFHRAPLMMAIGGLICQALPVPILLSYRCMRWSPLSLRIVFAAVYIVIPNATEIHVVCTNSHFHFALIEVLLALSIPPRTSSSRIFDIAVFLIGSVSGPFALILLPFLTIFWFVRRQGWSLLQIGLLVPGSAVQLYCIAHSDRVRQTLGATWALFVRLLGGDVYLGALNGSTPYGLTKPLFVCLAAFVIGAGLSLYCAWHASSEIRLFLAYCYTVLAASLRFPLITPSNMSPWMDMLHDSSYRYWFFPSLALLFAILWCLWFGRVAAVRWSAAALMLLLCRGIHRDWHVHLLAQSDFPREAARFESARPGTTMDIPIDPPGVFMTLTKK